MKTVELIGWLNKGKKEKQERIVKYGAVTYEIDVWWDDDEKALKEIIKSLEELEELRQCSIMGEGGKWVHVKDIQLVSSITPEIVPMGIGLGIGRIVFSSFVGFITGIIPVVIGSTVISTEV